MAYINEYGEIIREDYTQRIDKLVSDINDRLEKDMNRHTDNNIEQNKKAWDELKIAVLEILEDNNIQDKTGSIIEYLNTELNINKKDEEKIGYDFDNFKIYTKRRIQDYAESIVSGNEDFNLQNTIDEAKYEEQETYQRQNNQRQDDMKMFIDEFCSVLGRLTEIQDDDWSMIKGDMKRRVNAISENNIYDNNSMQKEIFSKIDEVVEEYIKKMKEIQQEQQEENVIDELPKPWELSDKEKEAINPQNAIEKAGQQVEQQKKHQEEEKNYLN
ncbi:MAG: hypothetical protein Q4G09_06715 [Clostridia bacterium]|nr:hypothetical protein [Clostridia bacterium]